ncbi:hypothetical protein CSE_03140 [Caldisericum exile AZM16c01]|uniref:Uncharacterized protein n=1 Tax=Caldisericum exile (strain DSM 21853 / NBRC 104410 / AZM16c01) TaxID=511051 RepID=A0A7U6GDP5_CALEA|nr:hypothetical protein CSE_03140 [Caldisericum exile AZM16c01]
MVVVMFFFHFASQKFPSDYNTFVVKFIREVKNGEHKRL